MRFYLDENVSSRVHEVLKNSGHEVLWTRDITTAGAADEVVAATAEEANAVLVSHDKDFRRIAPNIPDGQRQRFRRLSMIRLECQKPRAADRVSTVLSLIEFELNEAARLRLNRSIISIKTDLISIWR